MMALLSWSVLGAFIGLPYPDAFSGFACIGSTSFLFGLVFFVIMEIDNPLAGIWFIKNVHHEWMKMDVKVWREGEYERVRLTLEERIKQNGNGKNGHHTKSALAA